MPRTVTRMRPSTGRARLFGPIMALVMTLVLSTIGAGSETTSSLNPLQQAPPPNVLFLLDLSSAMNQDCCMGMPCLEDVKKIIMAVSRYNDWVNIGVIGTVSSASSSTYYPVAPLGSPPQELAKALSKLSVNQSDTRNFGEALWSAARTYFKYGLWKGGSANPYGQPIDMATQKTHVITLTKSLPKNDTTYYETVAGYLYNRDVTIAQNGVQNIVTHTIEIGGMDASDNYSNAAKATKNEGLYLTASTSEEVIAAISTILRAIRTDYEVRSVALVNTDDGHVYASQYALEHDGTLPAGDLLQYQIDTDEDSPNYGKVSPRPLPCTIARAFACNGLRQESPAC